MINFKRFIIEAVGKKGTNPVVFSFGRMNPPTIGHGALVDTVRNVAQQHNAAHEIVLSHSHDPKKNPLSPEQKLEHARRFFPGTNISLASKDQPTLLHHLSRLHAAGHDHAIVVAGGDRVPEYQKLLNHYNGKPDKSGKTLFNFKKIEVVSAGDRDPDAEGVEGMSASKMREHAAANNFQGFKQGIPKHVSDEHAMKMFNDTRAGMGAK